MKAVMRRTLVLIVCIGLFLILIPAASAQGNTPDVNTQAEETAALMKVEYGDDVIVGFERLAEETVDTPYKLTLANARELFPTELKAYLGGSVWYGEDGAPLPLTAEANREESVKVSWDCVEDYDEELESFHFTPVIDSHKLAEGLALPVLTLRVLGEREIPPLNYIPLDEELDIPILGALGPDGTPLLRGGLPSSYNSFEEGLLPPVRNQSPYGSCWSFASIGCVEADLIHDGCADTSIDLSELHLLYYGYNDYEDEKNCNIGDTITKSDPKTHLQQGGNPRMAYRLLANMVGSAFESDVPYSMAKSYFPGPSEGRAYSGPRLTGACTMDSSDREGIKGAIWQHGAVAASMYWTDSAYSATYNSFYGKISSANHAIMLVGWDDSFPKEHFRSAEPPEGDGAWLVRNSWGVNDYDENGYFWISYYDAGLRQDPVYAFDAVMEGYDHCYAYDSPMPHSNWQSYYSTAVFSQNFRVDGCETVEAVSFETWSPKLEVTLTLSSGRESVTESVSTGYPGLYSVPLSTSLVVDEDSTLTLTVSMSGETVSMIMEKNGDNVYGKAVFTAACGSGGISVNGINQNRDGRVKLYTNDYSAPVSEYTVKNSLYALGSGRTVSVLPVASGDFIGFDYTASSRYQNPTGIAETSYSLGENSLNFKAAWLDTLPLGSYYLWGVTASGNAVFLGRVRIESAVAISSLASLLDSGSIGYRADIVIPSTLTDLDNTYFEISQGGEPVFTCPLSSLPARNAGTSSRRLAMPLRPMELSGDIVFRVLDPYGRALPLESSESGEETKTEYRFSMGALLEHEAEHGGTPQLRALAAALADYGLAAENYFLGASHGMSDAVNGVRPKELADFAAVTAGLIPEGCAGADLSLLCQDTNSLRLYLDFDTGVSGEAYTFTIDGKDAELSGPEGARYLELSGIKAWDLGTVHSFSISDGTDCFTVSCSALSYCRSAVNSGSEAAINLGKALYLYGQAGEPDTSTG